jgi:hypothetical protein
MKFGQMLVTFYFIKVTSMIPRLRDKLPIIRVYAIQLLSRFQDPQDEDDEIHLEFIRMLENDVNR